MWATKSPHESSQRGYCSTSIGAINKKNKNIYITTGVRVDVYLRDAAGDLSGCCSEKSGDNNFLAKQTKNEKERQSNRYWRFFFFFKHFSAASTKAIDLGLLKAHTLRRLHSSAPAINLCPKGRPTIIHTLLLFPACVAHVVALHHFPLQIMRTVGPAVKGYLQQSSERRVSGKQ